MFICDEDVAVQRLYGCGFLSAQDFQDCRDALLERLCVVLAENAAETLRCNVCTKNMVDAFCWVQTL